MQTWVGCALISDTGRKNVEWESSDTEQYKGAQTYLRVLLNTIWIACPETPFNLINPFTNCDFFFFTTIASFILVSS